MADTETKKKGRGRPKAEKSEEAGEKRKAEVASEEETPVKRGRGRPKGTGKKKTATKTAKGDIYRKGQRLFPYSLVLGSSGLMEKRLITESAWLLKKKRSLRGGPEITPQEIALDPQNFASSFIDKRRATTTSARRLEYENFGVLQFFNLVSIEITFIALEISLYVLLCDCDPWVTWNS
ncbi:hypothetical protein QYM36_001680 [Artemia franciscana]|uniref:Uncharacterized protein n=1 Tax=Artemia franciscana TaxID=6661 RepID=A0AA88LCH0_ARTSF|nr:hypothetical protein QYM36_001680 [Artemia franciscana]